MYYNEKNKLIGNLTMFKSFRGSLFSTIAVTAGLFMYGCQTIEGDQQVITSANINEVINENTVNVVLLDGQSNALRPGLADAIRSELSERTGRETEIIACAINGTALQSHLLGGSSYKNCAIKRQLALSNPNKRLVGTILIQGEANINDTPYLWSSLFKQYRNQRREDLAYNTLPIVYSQLPHTVDIERYTQEKVDQFKQNQETLSIELYNNNVRMVVTEHLQLMDGVHFLPSASPELGALLVEQLYQLMLIEQDNGIEL